MHGAVEGSPESETNDAKVGGAGCGRKIYNNCTAEGLCLGMESKCID